MTRRAERAGIRCERRLGPALESSARRSRSRLPSRRKNEARRDGKEVRITDASEAEAADVQFMVLHEGRIHFEGTAAELLAARDVYVKEFMFMTLPPW